MDVRRSDVHVATMNFVVFVDDAAHRDWVVERAQKLAAKHPCRLIVLDGTGATQGTTVNGTRHDVGVTGQEPEAVVSLSNEHTVAGVPTVLWWDGRELAHSEVLARLVAGAQTVIVDSSATERGATRIKELADFHARFPAVVLHDLAFLRLGPWLDMIAQFFDDPALREDLFFINALQITSGSEAEAHYLGGWLGSRLSWVPVDAHTFRAHDGRHVRLEYEVKGDLRRVSRVVLTSDDSVYTALLSEQDPTTVCRTVSGAKAKAMRCAPLQAVDNISLIERALLKNARDQIFETSLETVRELLEGTPPHDKTT